MSNKCPKCGAKLSPFYLKPNCPSCGVNIVQYGFDERLENDKIRAEKEWERFDNFLNGLKKSSIGSPIAIVRLISFFLVLSNVKRKRPIMPVQRYLLKSAVKQLLPSERADPTLPVIQSLRIAQLRRRLAMFRTIISKESLKRLPETAIPIITKA